MKRKIINWLGIVLILEIGLLHFLASQAEFDEAAYMGYLFIANFLAALVAAYGIYRGRLSGWVVGAFISFASIAGYIVSRTQGMPGMAVEEWFTPYGVVAMTAEGLFLLILVFRPWQFPAMDVPGVANRYRYILPLSGLVMIALVGGASARWDTVVAQEIGQHEHVGDLRQVLATEVTSSGELEEKYGVQISLVASTAMNSIIDVRMKIVDPDKAHVLLANQSALMVGQQRLVFAPHMHSHSRLKTGKIYVMFFSSERQSIHPGSQISLIFGKVRLEPVTVQ